MKRRILSILLTAIMILLFGGFCNSAKADNTTIEINIDLSQYPYALQGGATPDDYGTGTYIYTYCSDQDSEQMQLIESGKSMSFSFQIEENDYYEIRIEEDPNHPIEGWIINGTTYMAEALPIPHMQRDFIDLGNDVYVDLTTVSSFLLHLGFNDWYYKTPGIWNISPYIPQSSLTVTASSEDDTKGTVEVNTLGNNSFQLTATPAEGYSFAYWLPEGAEDTAENRILENPYTVELTADAAFVAYFRERYVVNVISADESTGTVASVYIGTVNGADRFRLIATAGQYYEFEKWTWGENGSSTQNPYEISVTASGETYTAHFTPIQIGLLAGATLTKINNYSDEGLNEGVQPLGSSVPVGSRALLNVPFSASEIVTGAQLQVTVSSGDTVIAERSLMGCLNRGENNFFNILIDPVPAGITSLTIQTELITPGGATTAVRTYEGFSFEDSESNEDFIYVTSPAQQAGTGGYTVENGVSISGSHAELDAQTKALTLYFYGMNGVYVWEPDGESDIQAMNNGLIIDVSGGERGVIALGSDGEGGLIAAVETLPEAIGSVTTPGYDSSVTGASGSHFLCRWNGESWGRIENSCFSSYLMSGSGFLYDQPRMGDGCRIALICSATDIWTDCYHWNGSNWTTHDYGFVSFTESTEGKYAVDSDGDRWQYDGIDWTNVGTVNAPAVDPNVYYSGTTWQDAYGDWYLIVPARIHKVVNWYQGSDVYKWNGSRWVYQIISVFNDPDDDPLERQLRIRPDAVTTICSPSAGVSVMCGERGAGAIYLSADNVTITFDPSEGTLDNAALGTMTAPILSEIDSSKVPGASRDGFTFGGWYYDEACTVAFDAGNSVMPGEDITLYAKWTEGNAEDELQYYKDKAKSSLTKQYGKYAEADYTAENWTALTQAYADGQAAIDAAEPGAANIEDNVTAALNAAIAAMQAIPLKDTSKVTVAVSMDANTLGLGYILEPTLVTVDKGTPVSVVITDLLSQQAQAKYGITEPGKTTKVDGETLSTHYPWISDGAPTAGFYLSQVYYPEQTGYTIPATIQEYITGNQLAFVAADANGKYLGEFDYLNTSGWTYSVGDKTNGAAEFPGIGSNGWGLSDGEVVRWQFTLVGYGADLGADNTAWGTSNILSVGDKSALTWKVAELRSQYSDATLKTFEVYNDALAVLTNAEAEQSAIDAALAALEDMTFSEPPVIVTQPADQTAAEGKTATFTVEAEGEDLTYQWQYSKDDGQNWSNKSGATEPSYSVKAKASYDGMLYRCKVTGAAGSVYTGSAKLTVYPLKPVIVTQPADQTAAEGQTAAFAVEAQGEDLTYQWQYSKDGGKNWQNKSGATAAEYSVKAKASYEGMLYRCKVTGAAGSVYTGSAKLTVYPLKPVIVTQPQNQTADAGQTATFTAEAQGEDLTYQWQYSNDNGKNWHNKSGAAGTSYSVKAKASYDGMLYRCKVTSAAGSVYTDSAKLTVVSKPKPVITAQPKAQTVMAGETAAFTVVAEGEGLTFQWQYSNDGETWKNKSGATSASYSVKAKTSYDGILYRCLVTNDGGTVNSGSAKLTVTAAVKPVIETQPKAQTAAAGEKATFTVEASGTGLTYQWQYSSDYGKTWHDKAGSTAATHTVTVKASYNGYLYRCKVTNAAGTTVSSKVRLTVTGVKPKVLSQPADASAAAGEKATFKVVAAGEGLTYQWQYSTDGGVTWKDKAGSTKASHTVTVKANYNGYLYRCVVTNSFGTVTTATAVLTVG